MVDPLHFCYESLDGAVERAGPSALFVVSNGLRIHPKVKQILALGGLVYAYVRPISKLKVANNPEDIAFYMGDLSRVPEWGPNRQNNAYSVLTDIRPGSAWTNWLVNVWIPKLIAEGHSGAFLDVLGARPWGVPKAGETWTPWDQWSVAEQTEWLKGATDLLRRIHLKRMELKPSFGIMCNNIWRLPPAHPAASIAAEGDQYCDGVCLEHPPEPTTGVSAFHAGYAGRTFGGPQRRMVVVLQTMEAAKRWVDVYGITHVGCQADYEKAEVDVVPPSGGPTIAQLQAQLSDARLQLAAAQGSRDAAIQQRDAAEQRYDVAAAEASTLRDSLNEVNRLMSLNVAALEAKTAELSQTSAQLTQAVAERNAAVLACQEAAGKLANIRNAWQTINVNLGA